ncbi:Rab proteins geranylgeranyltransferase component A [Trichinella spiralis]|uniref:Rab proteins geranylgeranyltransferase component A n=1 Tax=Trichinella spiralis TaxID=6334 RepID=A0ABR3KXG4_TRISP
MSTFVPPPQVRVLQRQLRQYEKFNLMNQGVSLPVLMRDQNYISTPCRSPAASYRCCGPDSGIKITFRHPVEGEDCSHVYVEHCHQLRHIHFHTEALRHLTAVVGLIQVRDEHFRTSTAGRVLQRQLRIKITFRHPVEGEDCSHVYVEHCHQLRHIHFHTEALRHLTAVVGLIQVRDEHFRTSTAGIKITFRHPVEGEDCSHVYVEHCHQLRHVHFHTEALRHLTAVVGLIQVRDEHFRTSTAGSSITKTTSSVRKIQSHESGCQFTCPYEASKSHFDTLSKVKIVRMFTLTLSPAEACPSLRGSLAASSCFSVP